MARGKQHVFSARTTENGLRQLNEVKARLGVSWDDLVIDAVCDRYGLDRAVMAPPRKERPTKEENSEAGQPIAGQTDEGRPAESGHDSPAEEAPAEKKGNGKK